MSATDPTAVFAGLASVAAITVGIQGVIGAPLYLDAIDIRRRLGRASLNDNERLALQDDRDKSRVPALTLTLLPAFVSACVIAPWIDYVLSHSELSAWTYVLPCIGAALGAVLLFIWGLATFLHVLR